MSPAQSGFASFWTHFYFTGWCKAILDNCGFGLGMGARQEMHHLSFVKAMQAKAQPFQNKQRRTGHPEGLNQRLGTLTRNSRVKAWPPSVQTTPKMWTPKPNGAADISE